MHNKRECIIRENYYIFNYFLLSIILNHTIMCFMALARSKQYFPFLYQANLSRALAHLELPKENKIPNKIQ